MGDFASSPFSLAAFSLASLSIAPFWALMVLAPRWRVTERVLRSPFVAAVPVVLYAALVLPRLAVLAPALARPTLLGLATLLGTPAGAAIAWAHFLALDLLAGRWIFLDGRARGLPAWLLSPVLVLTLFFAPLGLAAYAVAVGGASRPIRALAGRLSGRHQTLVIVGAASLVVTLFALAAELVDPRLVLGASTWAKPAKFGISITLMAASLSWILGQMEGPAARRLARAGTLIAFVAAFELVLITIQAARGVPSHFNFATRLDGIIFQSMGGAISILWASQIYVTVRAFRHRFASGARTWGIRLGLVGSVLAGAAGFLMAFPAAPERLALAAGDTPAHVGAHAVGVPDGGPGLPVTHWSTEGGDLRVPHFIGLHALQLLPIAAVLLERRRRATRAVIALGTAYLGLFLVTLVQALRGQPLLHPDALTALLAAVVLVASATVAIWRAPLTLALSPLRGERG